MFGFNEEQIAWFGLTVGVGAFMLYMLFIIGHLAWESKAGKFGTFVIFLGLAFGMVGFVAKGIIDWWLTRESSPCDACGVFPRRGTAPVAGGTPATAPRCGLLRGLLSLDFGCLAIVGRSFASTNPVNNAGTSGHLSTAARQWLNLSPLQRGGPGCFHTGADASQVLVDAGHLRLVHKNAGHLLRLLLSIKEKEDR